MLDQKKKVHDLGELPALDWSNASVKLLVMTVVVGVILFSLYSGYVGDGDKCVQLGSFCLREWLIGLSVAVGAYFVIELLAKVRMYLYVCVYGKLSNQAFQSCFLLGRG